MVNPQESRLGKRSEQHLDVHSVPHGRKSHGPWFPECDLEGVCVESDQQRVRIEPRAEGPLGWVRVAHAHVLDQLDKWSPTCLIQFWRVILSLFELVL